MSEEHQPYIMPTDVTVVTQGQGEHPLFLLKPHVDVDISPVRIHPQDIDTIKQYIAEQVQAALHPTIPGLPDVHHFLRIEATDEQGKRWKGVLYGVEES